MYYCDINSFYAGKIVQYVLDNLSKEGKFYYSFPYDHKNGWEDGQDIYEIDELVCLIEYDEEQHYISRNTGIFAGEYDKIHNRDLLKNEYCKKKNIPLYRIRYDEDTILRLEEIFNELRS